MSIAIEATVRPAGAADRVGQAGFSIIELMVASVIAIVASLVMFQVFSVAEGSRRTTTYGNNAQTSGALGLYMIERDVRMAGYGLVSGPLATCSTIYSYKESTNAPWVESGDFASGLQIVDGGGAGVSDEIRVRYLAGASGGLTSIELSATMPQSSSELKVTSTDGCEEGGLVIVYDYLDGDSTCTATVMGITQVQEAASHVQHNSGNSIGGALNPSVPYQNTNGWPAYEKGAKVSCVPAEPYLRRFWVQNDALMYDSPTGVQELMPGIVALQAQYGINSNPDQTHVTEWVNATGGWADPSADDQKKIRALRIALVARSGLPERDVVTGDCTDGGGGVNKGPCPWPANGTGPDGAGGSLPIIDLSGGEGWENYRYKAFSTVVVPRNLAWR